MIDNLQRTESFNNQQALVAHLLEEARRQMLNYESERKKKVRIYFDIWSSIISSKADLKSKTAILTKKKVKKSFNNAKI